MEFNNLDIADYPAFLRLYNNSFPEDERRLYRDAAHLESFVKEKGGKFHAFCVKDGNLFLGFMSYWIFEGFIYIEHFAVEPENRGKNIGRKMLSHLFSTVGENVLIEVEKPETEEARRRISFYERNGFRAREEIDYIQPPYSEGQSGLEMLIMTHGDVRLKDNSDMKEMLREVYNVNHNI